MADTSWSEVVDAWVKRGAPRHVAEGIADAVGGESSFRSTVPGDGGTSVGLYQAHADRKASLQAQKNWQDPEVQHDWAKSQVTGGDPIATAHWPAILSSGSRSEARDRWRRWFERPAITSSDKPGGRFASSGIEFEQGRSNTSVRYMDPLDYLDMLPPIEDAESGQKNKRRALMKSLLAGDEIEAIPTIELSGKGDKRKIADFDGRHRAQAAADADLTMIPVAFRGVSPGDEPKEIVARNGEARPFSWAEVPKMIGGVAQELLGIKSAEAAEAPQNRAPWLRQAGPADQPPPTTQPAAPTDRPLGDRAPWLAPAAPAQPQPERPGFLSRELERAKEIATAPAYFAAGAAQLPVGVAQFAAHSAEAAGVPGAGAVAGAADAAERGLEGFVQRGGGDAPYLAGAGDIAASAALPVGRIAQLPRLARPLAQAAVGAGIGAAQPVTGDDYADEKKRQVLGGLAAGGALGVIGQGLAAAGGLVNKIVTPADVTRAAGRLFGADSKSLTPAVVGKQRLRISDTIETIEKAAVIPVRPQDLTELNRILNDASSLLPQEFAPIKTIVNATIGKAPTVIGKEIAKLTHRGTPLDMLTRSNNPNIRDYARQTVDTIRTMIGDALPPATKDVYRAAHAEWRDMNTVTDALKIGKYVVQPQAYAKQVAKRFPQEAQNIPAVPPPVLKLGRAVGELYGQRNRGAELMPTIGGLAAFSAGHALAGPLGGAAAYMVGHGAGAMARNRLIDMAIARSPNALQAIQPQPRAFGNMLTGLGSPQIAPAGAAAATMP